MSSRVTLPGGPTRGYSAEQVWLVLVAVVGLVLAASLTWLLVQAPAPREAVGPVRTAEPQSSPQTPQTQQTPQTGAQSPAAGAGLTAPGVLVIIRPTPTGDMEVVEQNYGRSAIKTLRLTLPSADGTAAVRGIHPRVSDLKVLADGRPTSVPSGGSLTSDAQLALDRPSTKITLSYRLSGVTVHTGPGPAGRVLAALSALSVDRSSTEPVVVRVVGSGVLNLVCPDLDVAKQLCGHQDGTQWTTPSIPAASARVIAQLNLTTA